MSDQLLHNDKIHKNKIPTKKPLEHANACLYTNTHTQALIILSTAIFFQSNCNQWLKITTNGLPCSVLANMAALISLSNCSQALDFA